MGKVKTVRIDAKGNLVEVDNSSTKEIRFDIETNTLKKPGKPKKGPSKSLQAGTRRFNKGGKV